MRSIINVYDLLRMQDVKRWHTVNTSRTQSLADHSLSVLWIFMRLQQSATEDITPLTAEQMVSILTHDAAEVLMGDIPTPGKRMIDKYLHEAEPQSGLNMGDVEWLILGVPVQWGIVPYDDSMGKYDLTPNQEIGLKVADLIEAYTFISQYGIGGHAKAVAGWLRKELNGMTDVDSPQYCGMPHWAGHIQSIVNTIVGGNFE